MTTELGSKLKIVVAQKEEEQKALINLEDIYFVAQANLEQISNGQK